MNRSEAASAEDVTEGAAPILPRPLEAVVCDMDGLLLDSEAAHWATMKDAAADLGFAFPDELFLRTVGVDRPHNRKLIQEVMGPGFPLDRFYEDSDLRFEEMIRRGLPVRPGAHKLLDTLDQLGLPKAVATSTAAPWAQERLKYAGLLDRFDTIVTLGDVARPKPAPDPYLLAVERLGSRPGAALAIEDSHNGVRAASSAGLATIMVPDLLPRTEETDRLVVATMASLGEVADLLLKELVPGSSSRP